MNCQEVMELMQRYLDKDLSDKEHSTLLWHLRQCPECTEAFERLRRLSADLENLPEVFPPTSIVDSIMPQLQQIEMMHIEEGASNEGLWRQGLGHAQTEKASQKQRFSWPWVSGVIAAGLILGVFVIQQPPLKENADDLLIDQTGAGYTQLAPEIREQTSEPNQSVDGDAPMTISNANPSETMKIQPSNARTENEASGSGSDSFEGIMSVQDQYGQAFSMNAMNEATSSSPQPEPSSLPEIVPEVSTSSPDGAAKADAQMNRMMFMGQQGPALATTDAQGLASTDHATLSSPDGVYTAMIEDNRVVVRKSDSSEVAYTSFIKWQNGDIITLTQWSEADALIYEVRNKEGLKQQMIIDVQAKSEASNDKLLQ